MIDEKKLIETLKEKVDEETRQKGIVTYEGGIHSDGFVSGVLWAIEIVKGQPKAAEKGGGSDE